MIQQHNIAITATALVVLVATRAEASAPISAEITAAGATTNVNRGHPVYADRTDPVLFNAGKLSFANVGPGSFVLQLGTATALMRHDSLNGHQLELAPSISYGMRLTESTQVSAGMGLKLHPYTEEVLMSHELFAAVEQQAEGFVLAVQAWFEVANKPGAYFSFSIARPFAFGALTFAPSISAGADVREGSALRFNDLVGSLSATYGLSDAVFLLGSVNYAFAHMGGTGSFGDRSTAWASLGGGVRF